MLLWAFFIPSTWFTGWRRPFDRKKLEASSYGTVELKCRVTQHFDTANIEKHGQPLTNFILWSLKARHSPESTCYEQQSKKNSVQMRSTYGLTLNSTNALLCAGHYLLVWRMRYSLDKTYAFTYHIKKEWNHDHINRARLRIDTRKWVASKLAPKIYGDKKESQDNGQDAISQFRVENE
jgi:hypothetical protein